MFYFLFLIFKCLIYSLVSYRKYLNLLRIKKKKRVLNSSQKIKLARFYYI